MEWITNGSKIISGHNVIRRFGETEAAAIMRVKKIRENLIEGLPKVTEAYSVEELINQGFVGFYKP